MGVLKVVLCATALFMLCRAEIEAGSNRNGTNNNTKIEVSCYNNSVASEPASNLGCVARSLIPEAQSYLVEFQHESSHSSDLCLETCATVYENAR